VRAEKRAQINRDPLPVHSPVVWRKQAEAERLRGFDVCQKSGAA
jgi:hypothetical protein